MADNTNDAEHLNDPEALRSRRQILKMLAGAPLVFTFGLAASPLMRFLKPTMKPGNFFQAADLPGADKPARFHWSDFPDIWTCLPFMLPIKYQEFNPEQYEIRTAPGFVIRTGDNRIVAFSRICPNSGAGTKSTSSCTTSSRIANHLLNFHYVRPTAGGSCGCADKSCKGDCIGFAQTPVLICPCDGSIFDVNNDGRAICGPARGWARQFTVERNGDLISISHYHWNGIA